MKQLHPTCKRLLSSQLRIITTAYTIVYASCLHSQTAEKLAIRYEKLSFEVRPGITMIAKFGEDGRACEMVLHEDRQQCDGRALLRNKQDLLRELVPANKRGGDMTPRFNGTIEGFGYETKRDYENVSIREQGGRGNDCPGPHLIVIHWKNGTCSVSTGHEAKAGLPLPGK